MPGRSRPPSRSPTRWRQPPQHQQFALVEDARKFEGLAHTLDEHTAGYVTEQRARELAVDKGVNGAFTVNAALDTNTYPTGVRIGDTEMAALPLTRHAFHGDWDALHRCFTDGDLAFENGEYPLSHVILGGVPLHEGDDYIVCYVAPEQVSEIAAALQPLDNQWLSNRFATLTFDDYQGTGDAEDIAYTRAFLPGLKNFYRTAAQNGRAAIFTVDQ